MYLLRRATLEGTLGGLPVEIRPFPWEEVGGTVPGTERFVESWAPWKTGGEYLFEVDPTFDEKAEDTPRYPHVGEDTDKYMEDTESETGTDQELMDWN